MHGGFEGLESGDETKHAPVDAAHRCKHGGDLPPPHPIDLRLQLQRGAQRGGRAQPSCRAARMQEDVGCGPQDGSGRGAEGLHCNVVERGGRERQPATAALIAVTATTTATAAAAGRQHRSSRRQYDRDLAVVEAQREQVEPGQRLRQQGAQAADPCRPPKPTATRRVLPC